MSTELKEIIEKIKNVRENVSKKYGVSSIGIFGSYAKGKQTKFSDVDVLVEISAPIGLFEFIDLEIYLTTTLNHKVDLVTKDSLKPLIRDSILSSAVFV